VAEKSGLELRQRIITGVLGGVLLILIVMKGGGIGILTLSLAMVLLMGLELGDMVFSLVDSREKKILFTGLVTGLQLALVTLNGSGLDLFILAFLAVAIYFLLTAFRHQGLDFKTHLIEGLVAVFGLLYLVGLSSYLPRLHGLEHGPQWTLLFLFIVWAGDTGAYFTGKAWGRHRLYEIISPKKSWEGAIGGVVFGYLVVLLIRVSWMDWLSWPFVAVAPLFVGAIAQVGDLWESFLKRVYGKKDSGTILPGHGGFLDRFDGVLFGVPVMYGLVRVFGQN
jgi:phosphatidate cytidylyltransferase